MADYNVILTHNPQDFFNGIEPSGYSVLIEFDDDETNDAADVIGAILDNVNSGYYAIVSKGE